MNGKKTVIIPAYNASKVINEIVDRIPHDVVDEIIVVDDGSKDETYAVLSKRSDIVLLQNKPNQGYGGAQIVLHKAALERGAEFITLMHADGGHKPEELPDIMAPVINGKADICIGSRMEWLYKHSPKILGSHWIGAAFRGAMPMSRFLGTEFVTFAQNVILGTHYNSFHSGFRTISRSVLEKFDIEKFNRAYLFDTELLIAAHYADFKIVEVPTTVYYDERAGSSVNALSYGFKVIEHTYKLRQKYRNQRV